MWTSTSGHLNTDKYSWTSQHGQILLDISMWTNISGHINVDKYVQCMYSHPPPPPEKDVVPQVVPPNDQKQFRRLRMLSGWLNVRGQDLTEILCRRFLRQFGNS